MQRVDDTGCLTQRSQLERLRELADGIVQDRVRKMSSPAAKLPTVLIVIDAGAKESTWDVESLASDGARLGRGTQWLVAPEVAIANFVPTQSILRILREAGATGAAIVAPVTSGAIARGMGVMSLGLRPRAVDELQAASAVGQGKLYQVYDELLRARGSPSRCHRLPQARDVVTTRRQCSARTAW